MPGCKTRVLPNSRCCVRPRHRRHDSFLNASIRAFRLDEKHGSEPWARGRHPGDTTKCYRTWLYPCVALLATNQPSGVERGPQKATKQTQPMMMIRGAGLQGGRAGLKGRRAALAGRRSTLGRKICFVCNGIEQNAPGRGVRLSASASGAGGRGTEHTKRARRGATLAGG